MDVRGDVDAWVCELFSAEMGGVGYGFSDIFFGDTSFARVFGGSVQDTYTRSLHLKK